MQISFSRTHSLIFLRHLPLLVVNSLRRMSQLLKKIELPPRGLETLFGVHDQNIKYLEVAARHAASTRAVRMSPSTAIRKTSRRPSASSRTSPISSRKAGSLPTRELREAFAQIAEDRAYSLRDYFTKARFQPVGQKTGCAQVGESTAVHPGHSGAATSFSASAWQARARPIWRWRWRCRR